MHTVSALIIIVAMALAGAWLNLRDRHEWHFHRTWRGRGMMRRKVGGRWQYREPTAEEAKDEYDSTIW